MAVTVANLYVAMRLGGSSDTIPTDLNAQLDRLLGMASARVEKYAPDAPEKVKDQATVQYAAFCYDSHRNSLTGDLFAASGARSMLAAFRKRKLIQVEGEQ